MINKDNYFEVVKRINFSTLPESILKGHEFINRNTGGGTNWSKYNSNSTFHSVADLYFSKLEKYIGQVPAPVTTSTSTTSKNVAPKNEVVKSKTKIVSTKKSVSQKNVPPPSSKKDEEDETNYVERIPDELRFMKRYVLLHGKTKTKEELLRFINSLQKAILEKRIRKTSPYAKEVRYMQDKLITIYNEMGKSILVTVGDDIRKKFKSITDGEKVMTSVQLIKKYIRLNGKIVDKREVDKLIMQMERATRNKKVLRNDAYAKPLQKIYKHLNQYLTDLKNSPLQIEKSELNGLNNLLGHCGCESLHGIENETQHDDLKIMNSMDFANMHFNTIGLKGKWLELIGDPSSNFTAMVYGKPKMGKSYLCVDFAGYLARHHGKVLYVAKEEGLDLTLQKKLNDKDVKHPNLFVANELPTSLAQFDFIFLDSVNKLGLLPEDLTRLKKENPTKSFVFVFQSTKEGNFRGANSFQHDVDVVIEVPERGKAIQFGRFNQGGEMRIF